MELAIHLLRLLSLSPSMATSQKRAEPMWRRNRSASSMGQRRCADAGDGAPPPVPPPHSSMLGDGQQRRCAGAGEGPTSFAPIIEAAIEIVDNSGGQYHVLLIIADGQVTRRLNTGYGQFSPQEKATIDATVKARKEEDFALSALMEIPAQFKAAMNLQRLGKRRGFSSRIAVLPPPVSATQQTCPICWSEAKNLAFGCGHQPAFLGRCASICSQMEFIRAYINRKMAATTIVLS